MRIIFKTFSLSAFILFILLQLTNSMAQEPYWEAVPGLTGGKPEDLEFGPMGEVYALLASTKIYYSETGNTWTRTNNPDSVQINEMTVDQNGNLYIIDSNNNLKLSQDKGITWATLRVFETQIYKMVIDSARIYIGTDNGIYIYDNQGQSWNHLATPSGVMNDLVVNRSGEIFIRVFDFSNLDTRKQFYRYDAVDSVWVPTEIGSDIIIQQILCAENNLYVFTSTGLLRYDDQDSSWISIDVTLPDTFEYYNNILSFSGSPDNPIFILQYSGLNGAVLEKGILISAGNDSSWQPIVYPSDYSVIKATPDGDIYIGTPTSILKSEDLGENWIQIDPKFANANVQGLAIDSQNRIFAAVYFQGIYRSIDNGETWENVMNGTRIFSNMNISSDDNILVIGDYGNSLFRSTDNGDTWQNITDNLPADYVELNSLTSLSDNTKFLGGYNFIAKSTNNGNSWQKLSGIPNPSQAQVVSHFINSNGYGYLFDVAIAYDTVAIYRTSDNGNHWQNVTNGISNISTINILYCANDSVIFAGMYPEQEGQAYLYRSTNNGDSWNRSDSGIVLPPNPNSAVNSIVSTETGDIFVGTNAGVFRSEDNGVTWAPYNKGMQLDPRGQEGTKAFAVDHNGVVYAGSIPNGLFRTTNMFTSVLSETGKIPESVYLAQNYPNPFNPSTTIEFNIPQQSYVTLKVYDLLGREVVSLVNNELQAGSYKTEFNGTNLSSGIYFYRLKADGFIQTKKFILMK